VDSLNIAASAAPITGFGARDLEALEHYREVLCLEDTHLYLDGVPLYPAMPTPENVR
jgi:hypothetical protein